jgi:tetratricopeptide (TPR) repeat protein
LELEVLRALAPEVHLGRWLTVCADVAVLEVGDEGWRFAHDKLRAGILDALPGNVRPGLHRQVAETLEGSFPERVEERVGMLAHHWEQAEEPEKAIEYLLRAGDQARLAYANEEAIALYRAAIEQVGQLLRGEGEPSEEWRKTAVQLHEGLGDVLEWTGQHDEARDVYGSALVQVSKRDPIWQARLHRKIGNIWRLQRRYEEALQTYDLAETALGREPAEAALEWWQERVQIQLERMWMYFWLDQWHEMSELADNVRPIVEQHGTPTQRVNFFISLGGMIFRRDRCVASEESLAFCQAALAISQESGNLSEIAWAQHMLGFNQLWHGDLDEAEEQMQTALRLAGRTGDVVHQSRCLNYLTILYRKRGQVEKTRHYISRSLAAATAAQMLEYVAVAKANLAWVAWREGNLFETRENGRAALKLWEQISFVYPIQWTALWPLIGVALAQDQISEAVDYARALLEPTQQCLPDALTAVVEEAIKTWEGGEAETARTYLSQAIELAQELG